MKLTLFRSYCLGFAVVALTLGAVGSTTSGHATSSDKLDAKIRMHLSRGPKFPALIVLQSQPSLTAAESLGSKAEKGKYVYETLRNNAIKTQDGIVKFLDTLKIKYQRYYITNMIAIEGATPDLIEKLSQRTDVAQILNNDSSRRVFPRPHNPAPFRAEGPQSNIVATGAERVWTEFGAMGQGITVAGEDSGYQWDHPVLIGHYRGNNRGHVDHNYNWHDSIKSAIQGSTNKCGYNVQAPCDDQDHGTHTMGTMVGDDGAGTKIGMAPKAKWIGCRNMDAGVGRPATYIECLEFMLAPYPVKGNAMRDGDPSRAPHVINNSWGCPPDELCHGDELLPALKALHRAGIFVVASAGNDGPGCSTIQAPPAYHSGETFSVGAYDHATGVIADFSSRGPSAHDGKQGPDISAPGVDIRSSVAGGLYDQMSGTSMAGPHVVGAVALLWSAHPDLIGKVDLTAQILRKSARPQTTTESCGGVPGSHIPNNTWGYGTLNVYEAVKNSSL